jgi:hypothetical protein
LRIALTHEFGIDHEVTYIDVCQEATITIPERHVQLEPDVFALDQMPVGLRSRVAEGLNAEITYMLMSPLDVYLDCGTVDYPEHLRSECVPRAERDRRRRR